MDLIQEKNRESYMDLATVQYVLENLPEDSKLSQYCIKQVAWNIREQPILYQDPENRELLACILRMDDEAGVRLLEEVAHLASTYFEAERHTHPATSMDCRWHDHIESPSTPCRRRASRKRKRDV